MEFRTANIFSAVPAGQEAVLEKGDYVEVLVTDTGIGIPQNVLPRIFEPFYTTKDVGKGSGLGLSTAYGIVKEHRGGIHISSAVGEGTSVSICLPVAKNALSVNADMTGDCVEGRGVVLVVDDEQIVREVAGEILQELGYTVISCCDGEQALELYGREGRRIDLVLLDLVMPVMDGYDCLRELRKINPGVRVIVSSGHSARKKVLPPQEEGLCFISKPYEAHELSKVVAALLGSAKDKTSADCPSDTTPVQPPVPAVQDQTPAL